MTLLFWLFCIPLTLLLAWHIRHYRRSLETPSRQWPDWAMEVTTADLQQHWRFKDLSILASAERLGAVLTLESSEERAPRRQQIMRSLAHQVYQRAEIDAVFIRTQIDAPLPDLFLFAPDGRGWHGDEPISSAFTSVESLSEHS